MYPYGNSGRQRVIDDIFAAVKRILFVQNMLFVGQSFSCKLCSVTVDKLENSLSKSE